MGDKTAIEWTDASWTPIRARRYETGDPDRPDISTRVGWHCEHVTEGCSNCYAESMNLRLGTGLPFKPGHRKDVEIFLDEKMLLAPLRWKKPRMVFVCSMTDLFASFVEDECIDRIFAVMAICPQHTFQVLTKRPERMRRYCSNPATSRRIYNLVCDLVTVDEIADVVLIAPGMGGTPPPGQQILLDKWPLPNVWLGTSCEDQATADERIPHLLATPAAVRFVSAEPLLEPITFERWLPIAARGDGYEQVKVQAAYGEKRPRIDWVIIGGESGPKARPFDTAWAESVVDQCRAARVACFVKQVGAHVIQGGERRIKRDKKGGDMSEWPHAIRVRQFPEKALQESAIGAGG